VITPFQIQIDGLQESAKGGKKIGTTKRGIGPTYADKVSRIGVRFCDFVESTNEQWDLLESMSKSRIENVHKSTIDDPNAASKKTFSSIIQNLLPYVGDSGEYLETEMNSGRRVLFEGAQGSLLDIDHGTYPYVTSSNCISAAASTGTGISFSRLGSVVGICKAYITRVGTGPFPTELEDDIGQEMRERGKEYGTVTGRPRRCGWLDLVALKYAIRLNGCKYLAITKVDVLTGIDPLKICVAYDINGTETSTYPASAQDLSQVVPVYEEIDGWSEEIQVPSDIDGLKSFPDQLQKYLSKIERSTGSKIALISVGPDRADTIVIPEALL
jgi:adenylosuccinate synthase